MPGNSRAKRSEFSFGTRSENCIAMPPSQRSMVLAFSRLGAVTLDRNLPRAPQREPPFPLHQRANCAKTGFGALNRKGFVEDEMGPYFEAALESDGRVHQHGP